jgi:protein gp138
VRRLITLAEILTAFGDRIKAGTYYTLPGIVVKFYSSTRTADVQPAVNDPRFDPDTGELILEDFKIIPHVPIAYPCGGGFEITWPLVQGDKVTLTAYDLDPTKHILTGNQEDPPNVGRQRGAFWRATPENVTQGQSGAGSALTIGAIGGGDPQISFQSGKIQLGASPSDFVALASKVDSMTSLLKALALILQGPGAIVGSSTGIPIPTLVTAATNLASGIEASGSTLVQAK